MTAWLLDDAPTSRRQAAWGRAYRGWRQFRRNRLAMAGLVVAVLLILASIFAPILATHAPGRQDLANRLAAPSAAHWLGSDELGRDLYSRILYGGRATLGIVLAVTIIVAPAGLLIGTVAGYAGGILDRILMRVTDVFLAFPALILALAFVSALRPGLTSAVIAIALTSWPPFARLARAETLAFRKAEFITAAQLTGASSARIVFMHIMPLCIPSIVVRVALAISTIILTAAGLGFLGMGAQPPLPEWGAMISRGRSFILDQWWVATMPGFAIVIVSLGFCFLGDGLRDVLDPKHGDRQ